jgi:hypothetical protein
MINWIKRNRNSIIKNTFLLPILLVVIMSISHVVSWYDLGNPLSWAIYLSIAIEIFALASVSAATIKINRASIWFLFGLVTFIQIIGNIFFEYREIIVTDPSFLSWIELIKPFFDDWDATDHRRLLAIVQGGTLPIMSLTALHYYMKFKDQEELGDTEPQVEISADSQITDSVTSVEPDDVEKYDPSELKDAINIWGQMHGSIDGISDCPTPQIRCFLPPGTMTTSRACALRYTSSTLILIPPVVIK